MTELPPELQPIPGARLPPHRVRALVIGAAVVVLSLVGLLLSQIARHRMLNRELARQIEAEEGGQLDSAACRRLISRGASTAARTSDGSTILIAAAKYDDLALVEFALEHGARVTDRDHEGATALMWAASSAPILQRLLAAGSDVNARNKDGETALFFAAGGDQPACVKLLLRAGAAADARSPEGDTPLMRAAAHLEPRSVRMLLQNGADPRRNNLDGATALDYASATLKRGKVLLPAAGPGMSRRCAEIRRLLLLRERQLKRQATPSTHRTAPVPH